MNLQDLERWRRCKYTPVSQRRSWLVEEAHAYLPPEIHCPSPGASTLLTSPQVWAFVPRQSGVVELTRDTLEVSHHHYPLRNKTCDGKYSQSNREWQIQTMQLPRHVGSLVQRSAHSSPGEEWAIPHQRERDEKKEIKDGGKVIWINASPKSSLTWPSYFYISVDSQVLTVLYWRNRNNPDEQLFYIIFILFLFIWSN